jgi:hypothetical protein
MELKDASHLRNKANICEGDSITEAACARCGCNDGFNCSKSSSDPRTRPFCFCGFFGFAITFSDCGNALKHTKILYGLGVAAYDAANLSRKRNVVTGGATPMDARVLPAELWREEQNHLQATGDHDQRRGEFLPNTPI